MISMIGATGSADYVGVSSRGDDSSIADPTGSFAGMLAGAMNTAAAPPPPPPAPEGTSELDQPDSADSSDGDDDTGDSGTIGTSKTDGDKRGDPSRSTTAANASTSDVVRSIAMLDPALQAKLSRVMDRVRSETGHDVSVSETYRSQARQNALYAQGRETAGPVVTWTLNSKHTQGRAVDVVLDDGTADPSAYASLQRIAEQEGLHTLGARDPGHLELAGAGSTTTSDSTARLSVAPADASGAGAAAGNQVSIARLAQLANVSSVQVNSVAQPAQVAQVAAVAQVAQTGQPGVGTARSVPPGGAPGKTAAAPVNGVTSAHAQGKNDQSQSSSGGTGGQGSGGPGNGFDQSGYRTLGGGTFTLRTSDFSNGSSTDALTSTALTGAERAASVIAAIQDAPPRPLSQLTMSVDAGNGATDRIQVALRGDSLATQIDAADPRAANAMSMRADELVQALSKGGTQVDSLQIRAATTTAATTAATVAAQSSGTSQNGAGNSSQSSAQSRFQSADAWQQQQDRQGSRQDRRQQQRYQRGGQDQ